MDAIQQVIHRERRLRNTAIVVSSGLELLAREQTIVASVLLHYRGRAEAAICKDRVVAPPCTSRR